MTEEERTPAQPVQPGPDLGTVPRTSPEEAGPEEAGPELDLEAVARERDEYLDALQRLKAEFDNYRKRAARDQASFAARANEALVQELLPIADDLDRALGAATVDSGSDSLKLEEGVRLVHQALEQALRKQGLEEIPANGRFDPHVHEALASRPSDREEGSVLEVIQKGYRLGDRVLRPARVVVAGPGEAPGGSGE